MRYRISFWLALATWLGGAAPAGADRTSVDLSQAALATYESAVTGLGNYYVLEFDAPALAGARQLEYAFLELIVDVDSREVDGYRDDTPLLEVYALTGALAEGLDPSRFSETTIPMVRNVALGQSRRVVIDITEVVAAFLADSGTNHGLILGSLTRRRDGLFTVRTGSLGAGVVARVTYFWR